MPFAVEPDSSPHDHEQQREKNIPGEAGHVQRTLVVKGRSRPEESKGTDPGGVNGEERHQQIHPPALQEKVFNGVPELGPGDFRQRQRHKRENKYNH